MNRPNDVCITIDLEQDCPPFLATYRGMAEGSGPLLARLAAERVPATFFATGDVARRFPDVIRSIVAAGHELGCHGDTHRRFDAMSADEARAEIVAATAELRRFYPVVSFRAPNLRFPDEYVPLLEAQGYQLDSSQAKYKSSWLFGRPRRWELARVPASTTSSVLRLPRWLRSAILSRLESPVVLFVHPWEFVDFRASSLRLDCRFRTGAAALACLEDNIRLFKRRGATFLRMIDLVGKPLDVPAALPAHA